MKITTVLFDLDGTLLPMDQDEFTKGYFALLVRKLAPLGYDPKAVIDAVWHGTGAMVKNDGSRRNCEAFWRAFTAETGGTIERDLPVFEDFYGNEFDRVAAFCGFNAEAAKTVALCRALGFTPVLATNPIFPPVAVETRLRWAGLRGEDFAHITHYENSRYCKPNPDYYREILRTLGRSAEECVMIGNDAEEDMIAETVGLRVFLLTDCLISRNGSDLSAWPHGGFAEAQDFLRALA